MRAVGGQTARPAENGERVKDIQKEGGGLVSPLCSLSAHDQNVLPQCAQ